MNRRAFLMTAAGPLPLVATSFQTPEKASDGNFGRELPIVKDMGIGLTVAAAVSGDTLYAIGGGTRGSLFVFDISAPANPKSVGKLGGLGHVRQIEVRGGVAYVTSREDGLFLIDVRRAERPVLLSHYDTIELATGIAVSGTVASIACRHWGVEQVDVSNPRRPAHLSTIRVGEAQSVASRNGYLYAGVWATRELVICDIRNPRRPVRVGKAELDGYGDGVAVRGTLCFAATGHHSKTGKRGRPQPDEPGYGTGHGLEIFDVSRPEQPRLLSRIKTRKHYRLFMDMWGVRVSERFAYLADTYNGIFVIDVSDPEHPRFVAHRQLPEVPARGEAYVLTGETVHSPVGGLAVGRDHIYVAGGYSDLHVVAAPGLAAPAAAEPDEPPVVPPPAAPRADPRYRVFDPGGQIHEVVRWGEDAGAVRLVIAAGSAGFHVARLTDRIQSVARYAVEDIAFSASVAGETVYIAEGMGGLSIWRGRRKLAEIGRYRVPGESVKQVVVDPAGRYAMLHVGLNRLEIVDVSNPKAPRLAMLDAYLGLFYRRPIPMSLSSGHGLASWGHDGVRLYDLSAARPPRAASFHYRFPISSRDGATPYGSGWLAIHSGKYFVLRPGEDRPPQQVGLIGLEGSNMYGKPTLSGNTLFLSDPSVGRVAAVDITNLSRPRLIGELELPEHPGYVIEVNGTALVPAGYQGLLLWKYRAAS